MAEAILCGVAQTIIENLGSAAFEKFRPLEYYGLPWKHQEHGVQNTSCPSGCIGAAERQSSSQSLARKAQGHFL